MKNISKFCFVLFATFVFTNPVFALSENITQINFTSSAQTIDVNTTSATLSTQTQNAEGALEQTSETNHLNLSTTSATGEFSSNSTEWNPVTTLTMSTGSANRNFYYRDSTPGTYTLTISVEGQTWTPATQEIVITGEEPAPTETFIIRNGDTVIYNGSIPLPDAGEVSINDIGGTAHNIDARSVLAILKSIDDTSDTFLISDLSYSDTYQSFLLNCITPSGSEPLCYNWQYVVNNSYPFVGMDKNVLADDNIIYVYFGPQNKVTLSSNSINTSDTLTVTAQKYDYENNAWLNRIGVTVGLTQPNPDDPWSPTEVQTQAVDANGQAIFSSIIAGSYNVGIQQDYYFPTETLTVSEAPSGGGGGGGGGTPPATFSTTNALNYLKSVQGVDGSFGNSPLYTDWAAIAFGAGDVSGSAKINLLSYFNSHSTLSSLLTDNERRAMALLALGQNPYSFNSVNYIKAITNSFDGTQFGDADLVNDDIFALIPLSSADYTKNDNEIIKGVAFIISKQQSSGSWENSVDITSASIQALKLFDDLDGVDEAISKAEDYLKNAQGNDGGWGNISSTSWAMQAESALNASWSKNNKNGLDYLATQQTNANNNGAVLGTSETPENIIWTTSYAIPAGLGKPWSDIMQSVSKPETENGSSGSPSSNNTANNSAEIPTEPIDPPASNTPNTVIPNTSLANNTPVTNQKKKKTVTAIETSKTTPQITPDTLTAEAVNALPNKTIPKSVPIVFGTVSGLAILYIGLKFFII